MKNTIARLRQLPFLNTISHFKNYFSAELATKALAFFSIPIFTRLLSTSEYGIWNVFNSWLSFFLVFMTMNVYKAVSRYYYEEKKDFKDFFSTSANLIMILAVLISAVLLLFKNNIANVIKLPSSLVFFLIIYGASTITSILFSQVFLPLKKSRLISIVNMAKAYLRLGTSLVFVLIMKSHKYLGLIYSAIIIELLFSIFFTIKLIPFYQLTLKKKYIKYIAMYSLPLIPYSLGGVILAQFDRIMINSIIGSSDAGLYSLAYNIGMLLLVFINAFDSAWIPDFYKYMNNNQFDKLEGDIIRIFKFTLLAASFLIFFGVDLGKIIAAKEYHGGLNLIPIIVIGYIFYSIFTIYSRNIGYSKRTLFSSLILITSGVINVTLNLIFIPIYGYQAGAYTTIVSFFFMAVFALVISKYIIKIYSIPIMKLILVLSKVIPFMVFSFLINYSVISEPIRILFQFLFFASVLIILFGKNLNEIFRKSVT